MPTNIALCTLMNINNFIKKFWSKSISDLIAVLCCLGMMAGFLFSRAILSISIISLFVNALHPCYVASYFGQWRKNLFALFCAGFFLSYLVSGVWSGDTTVWLHSTVDKIPFLVLPFAFYAVPFGQSSKVKVMVVGILMMQLLVIVNSIVQLGLHPDYYLEGYHVSRSLATTKYGDHIRFSLSLVLSCLIIFYYLFEKHADLLKFWLKLFLWFCLVIFIIYIHLLAAKTGILCLYIAAFFYILSKVGKVNKLLGAALGGIVLALPFMAYFLIPTFKTKIDYVIYEYQRSKTEGHFDYTLSDAGRMITYDIGSKAILAHPILGVGAGDLMHEMGEGYAKSYPEVVKEEQYGPINQFMFTALCVGMPLTLFLLLLSLAPFFYKVPQKLYLSITTLVLLVAINVEAMLEVQFGVLIYLFFILFWQRFLAEKALNN